MKKMSSVKFYSPVSALEWVVHPEIDSTMDFSLNGFIEFTEFGDKNICHCNKRARTCNLLCKRPGCYHSTSETHVRGRIFKLSPINASVIYQFHRIQWIPVPFRENSNDVCRKIMNNQHHVCIRKANCYLNVCNVHLKLALYILSKEILNFVIRFLWNSELFLIGLIQIDLKFDIFYIVTNTARELI